MYENRKITRQVIYMRYQYFYESYKEALIRFLGSTTMDKREADKLLEEVVSAKRPASAYPFILIK